MDIQEVNAGTEVGPEDWSCSITCSINCALNCAAPCLVGGPIVGAAASLSLSIFCSEVAAGS